MVDRFERSIRRSIEDTFRIKRQLRLAATLLITVVFIAACGSNSSGPGVANIVSTATATTNSSIASPSATGSSGNPVAYSECMRAHGIPDFPDPNANGGITIHSAPGSDLNPDSPAFQSAQNACKSLQPVPSAAQEQQAHANLLKYSQCMRTHGVPDFPDPTISGGHVSLSIRAKPGSDLSPNSPAFQAAQKTCQSLAPGIPGIPAGTSKGSGGS